MLSQGKGESTEFPRKRVANRSADYPSEFSAPVPQQIGRGAMLCPRPICVSLRVLRYLTSTAIVVVACNEPLVPVTVTV